MTGNTGGFKWFVRNPGISSVGLRTVAFAAGYISMGAIERKAALGMIEGRWFPAFGRMAIGTLGDAIGGKLFSMDILVTGLAIGPGAGEFDQRPVTGIRHISVTLVAGDFYMHPLKSKIALRVVVVDLVKGVNTMTKFAAVSRDQFVNLPPMRIFVASEATRGVESETEFCAGTRGSLLVTGEAGDCLVRAAKRIFGLLMLGHQEACRCEGLHRMALFAIPFGSPLCEFPFMKIRVTITAGIKSKSLL